MSDYDLDQLAMAQLAHCISLNATNRYEHLKTIARMMAVNSILLISLPNWLLMICHARAAETFLWLVFLVSNYFSYLYSYRAQVYQCLAFSLTHCPM